MYRSTDQTAHAPISLDADTIVVEIFSRCFHSTSQKSSHHHSTGTKSQSLDNVANVTYTTVSNHRDPKSVGKLRHGIDGSSLRSAYCHDFLGDTNRTRSHTDAETISTCSNKVGSLLAGDDVSGDNFELWEDRFDPVYHLLLVNRVALGRIEDYDIQAGFNQVTKAIAVSWASPDSGGSIELFAVWTLGCMRV